MDLISRLFNHSSIIQLEPKQVQLKAGRSPRPFLLDVRTPEEFKRGHIPDSVLIPLNELSRKLVRIPKAREIICICETGSRSRVAARQLDKLGYKVNNMHGGMNLWHRSGLPVKKGTV